MTMTSKSQPTRSRSVRDAPDLKPGAELLVLERSMTTLKGRFAGRVARTVSLQRMDAAIAEAAAGRAPQRSR